MSSLQDSPPPTRSIREKVGDEVKNAFALTIYFGTWFCALTFLALTTLDERPIPFTPFGIALIKAALCAKFLLIGQAIFPLKVSPNHGLLKSLFIVSILYIIVVLIMNYLEAGIDGLIHGKEFLISMSAFGQSNPLRVIAMSIVYWLIVWPYLFFIGLKLRLGTPVTLDLLFGSKN